MWKAHESAEEEEEDAGRAAGVAFKAVLTQPAAFSAPHKGRDLPATLRGWEGGRNSRAPLIY